MTPTSTFTDSPSAVELPGLPGMCPDIWRQDGTITIGGEDDGTGCPSADGTITTGTSTPAPTSTPAASDGPDGALIGLGIAAAILAVALIAAVLVIVRRGGGDQ